jgi:hypothetical protein
MGGGASNRPGRPVMDKNGKASRGRPPALTPEIHKAIIYNVAELAMPETRACQAEGLDHSTVGKWKTRGAEALAKWNELTPRERAQERRYVEFFEALRDAFPKYIKGNLAIIKAAADKGDWRAAERRLEFADRAAYGKRMLVGSDPKNPLPTMPTLGAVMILPSNGRERKPEPPPAPPAAEKKPDGPDSGTQGV